MGKLNRFLFLKEKKKIYLFKPWFFDEWTGLYINILLSHGYISLSSEMLCQENARVAWGDSHWAAVITTWVDVPNNSDLGIYKSNLLTSKVCWSPPTQFKVKNIHYDPIFHFLILRYTYSCMDRICVGMMHAKLLMFCTWGSWWWEDMKVNLFC